MDTRPTIATPIIVDEHGDVSFFASTEHAERKLEATDVRNGEYVAFDAEGRLLVLSILSERVPVLFGLLGSTTVDHVAITGVESEPSHVPQLRAKLTNLLEKTGHVTSAEAPTLTLQELIEKGVAYAGLTD